MAEIAERYEKRSRPIFRFRELTEELTAACEAKSETSTEGKNEKCYCFNRHFIFCNCFLHTRNNLFWHNLNQN